MWDLPGPGLEPVSPALAGGFSTTLLPGKPSAYVFIRWFANVFSQFSLSFHFFLTVPFVKLVLNFDKWKKINLFLLWVVFLVSRQRNSVSFPYLRSQRFSLIFYARNFMVLEFTFRFFDTFRVNFLYGTVRVWIEGLFFVVVVFWMRIPNCCSTICNSLPPQNCLVPLTRINWPNMCGSSTRLSILFHWPICLSLM